MVTGAMGRRLLVPADRAPSRERLLATEPFFLRNLAQVPPDAPPRLLSFESDSFMDDFLAVAGGKRPALPRLLPWRDWSEPPAGLVDAHGQARYATATLARRVPASADIEAASGPAMDTDGIPHGLLAAEKNATPPWLRKLYLPLHERFNLISFDVVCAAAGWPRVDRKRIKGSGAVIRRFIPAAAGSPERWEDWIAVDERHGAWLPLLPTDLHSGNTVDPAALPAPGAAMELRLRTLLDLSTTDPLPPLGLSSAPLSLLPPDAGKAAEHCTLYGYLPVFSAAREVPSQLQAGGTPAAVAAALSQQTLTRLDTLFQDVAGLRSAALPHLRSLLDATVLPPRPAHTAATTITDDLIATAPPWLGQSGNTLAHTIDKALLEALARLWQSITAAATDDADIAGNVRSGTDLWLASTAADTASAPGLFDNLPGVSAGVQATAVAIWLSAAGDSAWDTLMRERLHQLMDAWLAGSALPPPAQGNAGLIGTVVVGIPTDAGRRREGVHVSLGDLGQAGRAFHGDRTVPAAQFEHDTLRVCPCVPPPHGLEHAASGVQSPSLQMGAHGCSLHDTLCVSDGHGVPAPAGCTITVRFCTTVPPPQSPNLRRYVRDLKTWLEAQGAGFQLQENDVKGMGRADAGSASAPDDCAVVVNNPAAMSEFKTSCLQGDLTAINFGTQFYGSGTDLLGRPLTGDTGGDGSRGAGASGAAAVAPAGWRLPRLTGRSLRRTGTGRSVPRRCRSSAPPGRCRRGSGSARSGACRPATGPRPSRSAGRRP